MHSFQNFIVRLIPNHPPPLETRIWKLVVRALSIKSVCRMTSLTVFGLCQILSKDLPNVNTFCDWLSETIVISVYDSFFRNYISVVLLS